MRYVLIDFESGVTRNNFVVVQPERVIWDDKQSNEVRFVCEKCFKDFSSRNLVHLEKCRIEWPLKGLCSGSRLPSFMLYKIDDERDSLNNRIMGAVIKLARYSKFEQGIDNIIPGRGLLRKRYISLFGTSQFCFYAPFVYKNIIAYCWVQIYSSLFGVKRVVIRDIYVLPVHRNKGIGSEILKVISKEYGKNLDEMIYSMPVSEKLKGLLKKQGVSDYIGIQGENIHSLQICHID